eukprot:3938481-Rhodomonas_salina.2
MCDHPPRARLPSAELRRRPPSSLSKSTRPSRSVPQPPTTSRGVPKHKLNHADFLCFSSLSPPQISDLVDF